MIEILHEMPVIFTKDKDWIDSIKLPLRSGQIVFLPDDAVLLILPRKEVIFEDVK